MPKYPGYATSALTGHYLPLTVGSDNYAVATDAWRGFFATNERYADRWTSGEKPDPEIMALAYASLDPIAVLRAWRTPDPDLPRTKPADFPLPVHHFQARSRIRPLRHPYWRRLAQEMPLPTALFNAAKHLDTLDRITTIDASVELTTLTQPLEGERDRARHPLFMVFSHLVSEVGVDRAFACTQLLYLLSDIRIVANSSAVNDSYREGILEPLATLVLHDIAGVVMKASDLEGVVARTKERFVELAARYPRVAAAAEIIFADDVAAKRRELSKTADALAELATQAAAPSARVEQIRAHARTRPPPSRPPIDFNASRFAYVVTAGGFAGWLLTTETVSSTRSTLQLIPVMFGHADATNVCVDRVGAEELRQLVSDGTLEPIDMVEFPPKHRAMPHHFVVGEATSQRLAALRAERGDTDQIVGPMAALGSPEAHSLVAFLRRFSKSGSAPTLAARWLQALDSWAQPHHLKPARPGAQHFAVQLGPSGKPRGWAIPKPTDELPLSGVIPAFPIGITAVGGKNRFCLLPETVGFSPAELGPPSLTACGVVWETPPTADGRLRILPGDVEAAIVSELRTVAHGASR